MEHLRRNNNFMGNTLQRVRWNVVRAIIAPIFVFGILLATSLTPAQIVSAHPLTANNASAKPPAIVIGFVGGFIAHDNPVHSEVQLAARLRKEYPAGVDVETFESYRGDRARQKILALLDANHDGNLTAEEKGRARIIIYGHSWGGAETITLARSLQEDGIPVLLLLQVDTVSRPRSGDTIIPANVAEAANFYQSHGLLRGQHDIRAADASRTRIIGNFQFDYENSSLQCSEYPWYDHLFFIKPHTQIECDPGVWDRVESLIRSSLLPLPSSAASR
jgi:hypothetical protein